MIFRGGFMKFGLFFKDAKKNIIIIGTNSLIPHLEENAGFFADLLNVYPDLELKILYESDNENFNQSLCIDTNFSKNGMSYSSLKVHRDRISGTRSTKIQGFYEDILDCIDDDKIKEKSLNRILINQFNLRLPLNIIKADEKIWYCFHTHNLSTIDSYIEIPKNEALYEELNSYIDFILDPKKGGIYLSKPQDELIELYDNQGYPRGIIPRSAFYSTKFQRYSIWGFVFNRKGELLLHQRSKNTSDNKLLWDKSVGGHVDLSDSSTYITAQRELVEELFLPEAEFTKYVKADLGDIINFGDWNPEKRPAKHFKNNFRYLDKSDWILFRATDGKGDPLTISRISNRKHHLNENKIITKRTRFISDVYLFIAPPNYIDTKEQMKYLVEGAEETGSAQDHRLVTIQDLNDWIEKCEETDTHYDTFTDDLLYMNLEYRWLLESFSEFVKFSMQEVL